jgi:phosphoenolpyruvate synthase/pyruvate phosphate dikinase
MLKNEIGKKIKKTKKLRKSTKVKLSYPQSESWDQDNTIKKKYKTQFPTNHVSKDKKKSIKKRIKNNSSQLGLTY